MNALRLLLIILLLLGVAEFANAQVTAAKPTIFVCGDSTAKNSGRGRSGQPVAGWGTPIVSFFDAEKVLVKNVGHAGRSSRTYYDGDWPSVLPQIQPGDFVLLVFGINDGSTPPGLGDETVEQRGQSVHTYGWYMSKMATDAQEKGAHVYLLTVTTRNIWRNPKARFRDATPIDPLPADYDPKQDQIERGTGGGRFTRWTQEIGEKLQLPVFDLTNFCADQYESLGREEVDKFYSDHNHTYLPGAQFVATSIVAGLKAFHESPFLALLSAKGQAVETADAKFISDNAPPAAQPAESPTPQPAETPAAALPPIQLSDVPRNTQMGEPPGTPGAPGDLYELIARKYETLGPEKVDSLYEPAPRERHHPGWAGAVIDAEFVIAGLKGLPIDPLAAFYSVREKRVAPIRIE